MMELKEFFDKYGYRIFDTYNQCRGEFFSFGESTWSYSSLFEDEDDPSFVFYCDGDDGGLLIINEDIEGRTEEHVTVIVVGGRYTTINYKWLLNMALEMQSYKEECNEALS